MPLVSAHGSSAETNGIYPKQSMVRIDRRRHRLPRQALKGLPRNDDVSK